MTAQRLRVGQLACAPDALAGRCATYSFRSRRHGVIVAVTERQAAVERIDYRGLQHDTCVLRTPMPCAGTLSR